MALVSGSLAPLHRLPWQQLTLHFLIVAPFGANALQSTSLPQADLRYIFWHKLLVTSPGLPILNGNEY